MHTVTIRDIKNNPANMTAPLENGHPVFVTKHGKPIGVTIPMLNEMVDQGVKELLYFDLYDRGEISFGKLAQFLGTGKRELRKMFDAMNKSVIDYSAQSVAQELELMRSL
jgi:antitoxin (DNA-binding transcriptional repressor) of toxin-antitoxin stability system